MNMLLNISQFIDLQDRVTRAHETFRTGVPKPPAPQDFMCDWYSEAKVDLGLNILTGLSLMSSLLLIFLCISWLSLWLMEVSFRQFFIRRVDGLVVRTVKSRLRGVENYISCVIVFSSAMWRMWLLLLQGKCRHGMFDAADLALLEVLTNPVFYEAR